MVLGHKRQRQALPLAVGVLSLQASPRQRSLHGWPEALGAQSAPWFGAAGLLEMGYVPNVAPSPAVQPPVRLVRGKCSSRSPACALPGVFACGVQGGGGGVEVNRVWVSFLAEVIGTVIGIPWGEGEGKFKGNCSLMPKRKELQRAQQVHVRSFPAVSAHCRTGFVRTVTC